MRKFYLIAIISLTSYIYSQQININRIEQMPDFPSPYEMRDWKKVALGYDSLVYNFNLSGQYLPLISLNTNTINYPEHQSFKLHTVVGTNSPGSGEAINVLPSVIGASLVGVDKSNQNGYNFVLMCEEWFNKENGELVYLNHPSSSTGDDWWYETMPNIFFYQLYDLYPETGDFNYQFTAVADRWLEAVDSMGGNTTPWQIPYMNYRAWNLITMKPLTTDVPEPEAAGAIAWILYNAFIETGEDKYRIGAEWAMEFLNNWNSNPSYELQLGYGVYTAARMNAELGTNYNIQKLINWCFDIGPLRQWGAILGNWGGYDVHGLIGESISNDYAFIMNGFELASALVPLVRYDDRFARAIGKWMLNLSNATRLFYTNYLPDSRQDSESWSHQYDQNSYIAHEALRESQAGTSPYATGDAISGGWGETNLALYGSSHVGIFGGIIDTTNVEGILKLDLLKTDYFQEEAYPSFLFYNPYESDKDILINVGIGSYDIYDAVSNSFIQNDASGNASIQISEGAAVLAVIVPSGGNVTYDLKNTLVNNVVIDYNNEQTLTNYPPRIKSLSANHKEVLINSTLQVYCTAEDINNDIISYSWRSSGGTISGTGAQINFESPANTGNYSIRCVISDGNGGTDSAEVVVKVAQSINHDPVIKKIKASPRKIDLGKSSVIKCFSSDPDNDILTFTWSSFAGTISGNDSSVTWTAPDIPGNYSIKCIVDDQKGGISADSITVSVRDFSIIQTGDLVAFYPFNGNANDESGNDNNGSIFQAGLTNDRFGNQNSAYNFDGVNDYIQIQNKPVLNFENSISINFWMRLGEFYEREAYPISHGNWETRWKISITNKKVRWTIKTSSGVKDLDSETELFLDSLYNVTAIYDGRDFEVYINGELDAFTFFDGNILTTSIDLMFGQVLPGNSNYNFKGVLDDIRIYDYAISYSDIQNLYDINTSMTQNNPEIPLENYLYQNYPNPFNGESVIGFNLIKNGEATLEIYNILGAKIRNLVHKEMQNGFHSVTWDGRDDKGEKVSSGVYIYELRMQGLSQKRKMLFIQ